MGIFSGKIGLVMGVANDHSIAWAMSQSLYAEGAELAFTHLPSPSSERRVRQLVEPHDAALVVPCDVQRDEDIAAGVRGRRARRTAAWISSSTRSPSPRRRNCASPICKCSRAGWHLAMDISVYSLVAACRAAAPLMSEGGAIVTISYFGGEKVMPGYNVMGVCKAALEHSVRYLAWDLGRAEHPRQRHQRRPHADAQRGWHRRLRRPAPARGEESAAGPQRRSRRIGRHRPLSARRSFRRRDRRDDPRRLRLQHRRAVAVCRRFVALFCFFTLGLFRIFLPQWC